MSTALLKLLSHPSQVTNNCTGATSSPVGMCADISTDFSGVIMLGNNAGTLSTIEIMLGTVVMIGSGRIVEAGACAVELLLTNEWAEVLNASVSGVGAEVNSSGLTTATAALDFAVPASSGEPFRCCWARFICWLTTILDCARPLQASRPPNHV